VRPLGPAEEKHKAPKRQRWDLEKLYAERQNVQDTLKEKLGATERESGNVEVRKNNIHKLYQIL
jgi:oligoendopeptidase F